jgi:hypothetical protein
MLIPGSTQKSCQIVFNLFFICFVFSCFAVRTGLEPVHLSVFPFHLREGTV